MKTYINKLIELNKNLNYNSLKWQILSQGFGLVYLLVATSIRAKLLTLENFANIAIAIGFVASFQSIFNLQTWRGVIKFGNEKLELNDFHSFINILKNGLIIDALSIIFSFLSIISFSEIFANFFLWGESVKNYIYILTLSVFFNFSQGTILGYFRLENMFVFIAQRQIFIYVLFLCINLSAFFLTPDPMFFVWVYIFQIFVTELINVYYFFKSLGGKLKVCGFKSYFSIEKSFLKFNFWIYVKSLLDIPYRTFDIILASKFLSVNETGIYAALKRLLNSFNQVMEPLNIIIYPKLSKHASMSEIDLGFKFLGYINKRLTVFFTFIALVIVVYAKEILSLLFNNNFIEGYFSLIIIVIMKFPFYGLQLYYSYFIVLGFAKQASLISAFATFVYLISSLVLSNYFGLDGFVFSVSIYSLLTTLLIFPYLKQKYNFNFFN